MFHNNPTVFILFTCYFLISDIYYVLTVFTFNFGVHIRVLHCACAEVGGQLAGVLSLLPREIQGLNLDPQAWWQGLYLLSHLAGPHYSFNSVGCPHCSLGKALHSEITPLLALCEQNLLMTRRFPVVL